MNQRRSTGVPQHEQIEVEKRKACSSAAIGLNASVQLE
jgi:hypothetical protein